MKKSSIRNFSKMLILAGIIMVVISIAWWQQTFGFRLDFIRCLLFSDGRCRLGGIRTLLGSTPYNPLVFLAGSVCVMLGFIIKKLK